MTDCRHGSIVTYAISDSGDERMWACADCMIRFYPACRECVDVGHRNEQHVEPPLDEERLARALRKAATYTAPATHSRPEAREEQRLWYHGAIASLDWIAKAYREDTE